MASSPLSIVPPLDSEMERLQQEAEPTSQYPAPPVPHRHPDGRQLGSTNTPALFGTPSRATGISVPQSEGTPTALVGTNAAGPTQRSPGDFSSLPSYQVPVPQRSKTTADAKADLRFFLAHSITEFPVKQL